MTPFCLAHTRVVVPDAAPSRGRTFAIAAIVLVAIAYSWAAGHLATFTRPAEVATFLPGLLAVVIAARITPRSSCRPDRSTRGWLTWWVIAIALTAVEIVALGLGASHAHPTISDLVNPWLSSTPGRAAAFALWLGFGFWLVRR
jgi:hypothetical protein